MFIRDSLMQQGWQADDIVSVLKLLGWDAVFVRAALRDDVVILTFIPPEPT